MGDRENLRAPHSVAARLCAILLSLAALFFLPLKASAQDTAIISRGDAAVTAFSGARQLGEVPADLHPLDVTYIDLNGPVLQVFDLTQLGGAPDGQVANAPIRFQVTAGEIGQVFPIALDGTQSFTNDSPDSYLGATSAFGLQIVIPGPDDQGRPERVKTGQPEAEWMAGQFGPGGGPGSIWKVDGKTGVVSLFATISGNSGPGLGDIVFDLATRQFFVSDLDTGLIHRLDSSGALLDTFDHGQTGRTAAGLPAATDDGARADIKSPTFDSENPATWGFTQPERRVWGLGLRAGRLYYAVADGPSIWSVSINLDGTFGADPRLEIEVSGTPANHPISDIAFDNADYMYIAQRGGIKGSYDYSVFADAKQSVVWRFAREIPDDPATPGIWAPIPDEYAIGFPPDYRNTSGGIALGYGYDEAGNTRGGACDAFIWSTGDSLRDNAEYADELVAGGAAIINGLQGNDRTLVRPDNEPPFTSYFVDYDGKFDDAQNQGHVGDVEIWQPCDPKADFGSYAPTPYLPPEYYFPPDETPPEDIPPGEETPPEGIPPVGWPEGDFNLVLDKEAIPGVCVPGGLGFLCDYVVRVTNVGPDAYVGPIVVNDSLPAAPAGAVMTFVNVPPWFCFAISPAEHECIFGPTVLLPGDSVDLYVTVDLPVAPPVCWLDNVAYIAWPLGAGDANPADDFDWATAAIPAAHCPPPAGETANLKIEKFPLHPVCRDAGAAAYECDYLVVVRNTGPGDYDGSIKIDEIVPAWTTATFSGSPKWTFSPAPPYTAEHDQVVLNPGQSRSFGVVLRVPKNLAADLACNATNKVKIAEAAGGTDQNTDPTDDEAEATMILPGEVADCPDIHPLTNLKLFKTGPDEKCPPEGDEWVCEFKIKVQNFGGPYTSPIQIADALPFGTPAGATISFTAPAGWSCGGPVLFPNLYQCSSDNPNFPHMGSAEIIAKVKIPIAPGIKCEVTNNALITKAPGGTLLNSFAGDDMSSATAVFEAVLPLGGAPAICLSPAMGEPEPPLKTPEGEETNLTITKEAGPSEATATGQNTAFTITVTNKGPGVYNGPIEVRDTLFGGAIVEPSNGSWSPPWVCEGQSATGHPEQGICTHPGVELDPGESVVLTLEAEAPNSFVAPSGSEVVCGYENEVEILKPAGGTPQNTDAGDDAATADVTFAPFEKHGQTFCELGLITPPPACPQGWSQTPVPGKCCPADSAWDGEQCKRGETPPTECEPGPNETRNAQGQCVCQRGYERDKSGRCVEPSTPEDECEDRGWIWNDRTGTCVPPVYPEDECEDRGWTWNYKLGICLPPIIYPEDECERRGWIWSERTKTCKPPFDPEKDCKKKGWVWNEKTKTCKPPFDPAADCKKKGWVWDDNTCIDPAAICKAKGWVWNPRANTCTPPPDPAADCKKKGWVWNERAKTCNPPPDPAADCKKKGWVWNEKAKTCNPPPDPAADCKKKGWVWNEKAKTCNPPPDPAAECKNKGWDWNNKNKKCTPPRDPAADCKKKGWLWDPRAKACNPPVDPAADCKKKGWDWNNKNKKCTPPRDPAADCKKKGWDWNGKTCNPPADPAADCKKKGWEWNGKAKTCKPPSASDPATECRKSGKVWDGKRCLGQAEQCKASGGVWDKKNKTCKRGGFTIPR